MAWPMWRYPVTLGGGMGTTYGFFPPAALSSTGLKKPWDSHHLWMARPRVSVADGQWEQIHHAYTVEAVRNTTPTQ
eukprot:37328-Eustigmatos_ZCMA.PRE.1